MGLRQTKLENVKITRDDAVRAVDAKPDSRDTATTSGKTTYFPVTAFGVDSFNPGPLRRARALASASGPDVPLA